MADVYSTPLKLSCLIAMVCSIYQSFFNCVGLISVFNQFEISVVVTLQASSGRETSSSMAFLRRYISSGLRYICLSFPDWIELNWI